MEFEFLKDRLERFLAIIVEPFKIADDIKKSPKGLSVVIERDVAKAPRPQQKKPTREAARGKYVSLYIIIFTSL